MTMTKINIREIITNPNQPREYFDDKALAELAESIKNDGLMTPIMVRPLGDKYEIVQGERRYRASKMAGLSEVSVNIREMNDVDAFHLAVIENIQREQLSPIEEAQAFMKYVEMGFTHEQIAKKVSKGRTYVTSRLRLLKLMPELQDWIASKKIAQGHVVQLLKYETDVMKHIGKDEENAVQKMFYERFRDTSKISVNDVKKWGDDLKVDILSAIIHVFFDAGDEFAYLKYYCEEHHLNINTVKREDIEFLLQCNLENRKPGEKLSKIYARFEELEYNLFDSDIAKDEIWESRGLKYFGERSLEEIASSIKEKLVIVEQTKSDMVATYRKYGLIEDADRIEKLTVHEYMDEIVSRDTLK